MLFLFQPVSPIPACSRFISSLALSFALSASRAEGTSEGSGWLSLLEADGRPKARRPRFHEACLEHARIMSRGMPMDDGCLVRARVCLCVSERFCGAGLQIAVCLFLVICSSPRSGSDDASRIFFQGSDSFEALYSRCPASV